ncbi:MAG: hypothetical protein KF784_06845 [Fimbriimonadaceae bacterium]|nr:hypothetical protein [Fimbriimonadaceae bacterium]
MSNDKLFVIGPYEQLSKPAEEAVEAQAVSESIFKSVVSKTELVESDADVDFSSINVTESAPVVEAPAWKIVDARFSRPYCLIPITDDLVSGAYVDPKDETKLRPLPESSSPVKLFLRRRKKQPPNGLESFGQARKNVSEVVRNKTSPITDVYIFSHGWHRNFYSALSAYDRILSRFSELFARGRLKHVPDGYNPLFLAVHYHSDTGEDDWVDYSGRKEKGSFMRLVEERLEPIAPISPKIRAEMKSDFEDLFDLFSKLSAPEVDPFAPRLGSDAYDLGAMLNKYRPSDYDAGPGRPANVTQEEVLTIAWTCYHESDNQKATTEQDDDASRFVSVTKWLMMIINVVIAGAGLATVIGFITQSKALKEGVMNLATRVVKEVFPQSLSWTTLSQAAFWIGVWTAILWLIFGVIFLTSRDREYMQGEEDAQESLDPRWRKARRKGGLKAVGTLIYLLLQTVHAIPILLYCLVTPFFATMPALLAMIAISGGLVYFNLGLPSDNIAAWSLWAGASALSIFTLIFSRVQFQERIGKAGEAPSVYRQGFRSRWRFGVQTPRKILLGFARFPAIVVAKMMKSDERVRPLWVAIENQFAFWRMSRKATVTGEYVFRFLKGIVDEEQRDSKENKRANNLAGARIHLLAHSHGGLVVANAARWIANDKDLVESPIDTEENEETPESTPKERMLKLQTVCTINGAFMSTWYEKENVLLDTVKGCVASIYSRYDVANSFWYPLANLGRKSAGYVGLWLGDPHPAPLIGEPLPSASLIESPNFADRIRRIGRDPKGKKVLNIDGSRLVFAGPALPQGSHNDVYKDETVLLFWAATVYEQCLNEPV